MSAYKTDSECDGEWFIVQVYEVQSSLPAFLGFLINTIFVQMNFILDCLY